MGRASRLKRERRMRRRLSPSFDVIFDKAAALQPGDPNPLTPDEEARLLRAIRANRRRRGR